MTPEQEAILKQLALETYNAPTPAYGTDDGVARFFNRMGALGQLDAAERSRRARQQGEDRTLFGGGPPSMLGGPRLSPPSSDTPSSRPPSSPSSFAPPTSGGGGDGETPLYRMAISSIESGGHQGNYTLRGPVMTTGSYRGDRAYGRYQVMGRDIPTLTQRYLGRSLTPEQFLADTAAQDAVFDAEFRRLIQSTGSPELAAVAWFAGEGRVRRPETWDAITDAGNTSGRGLSVRQYHNRFSRALAQLRQQASSSTPQTPPGQLFTHTFTPGQPLSVVSSTSVSSTQPTVRRIRPIAVGPDGVVPTDGLMRLGGPKDEETQVIPTQGGPRPVPSTPELDYFSQGLPPQGDVTQRRIRPPGTPVTPPSAPADGPVSRPTTPIVPSAPSAPSTSERTISTGDGEAVRPPSEITSLIEQSIPSHSDRIAQIRHLWQSVPMSDARRQQLETELTQLTAPQTVQLPNQGTARYTFNRRTGRFELDSFQGSASVRSITAGGTTTHGILTYDRNRGWRIISPSHTGESSTQGDELGLGPPPSDPAGLAAWNLRLQTLSKDVEDNAAQRRTIIAEIRPLAERMSGLESINRLLTTSGEWRGVGSEAALLWNRFASQVPMLRDLAAPSGTALSERDLVIRLTEALNLVDRSEPTSVGAGISRLIPQIFTTVLGINPSLADSREGARAHVAVLLAQLDRQRRLARHVQGLTSPRELRDLQTHIDRFYRDNPLVVEFPAIGSTPSRRVLMQILDPNNQEHRAMASRLPRGTVFLDTAGRRVTVGE